MTKKLHPDAEDLARSIVALECGVDATDAEIVITLWNRKDVEHVTFAMLAELSRAFHTRHINLRLDGGWAGTDVTPGNDDSFAIVITGWKSGGR